MDIHIVGYLVKNNFKELIACLNLKIINDFEIKMRQIAVLPKLQGNGYGKRIVNFAENKAKEAGYKTIILHSREYAIPFYKKMGYEVVGEKFIEVTIPHFKMKKIL